MLLPHGPVARLGTRSCGNCRSKSSSRRLIQLTPAAFTVRCTPRLWPGVGVDPAIDTQRENVGISSDGSRGASCTFAAYDACARLIQWRRRGRLLQGSSTAVFLPKRSHASARQVPSCSTLTLLAPLRGTSPPRPMIRPTRPKRGPFLPYTPRHAISHACVIRVPSPPRPTDECVRCLLSSSGAVSLTDPLAPIISS